MRAPFLALVAGIAALSALVATFVRDDTGAQRYDAILSLLWLIIYLLATDRRPR